ncbi:hypothetical protein HO173_010117 [Letharia columbiana]|uniref:Uncharacterized protein n=1 Tax=Letharia columbiana TaxID=112416 RepID=A0A8H6L119_9LECA|nr:uncharacterized protein HO173_010117 [Letharia columbiana]KAF6231585.1 hypothetical protein HO173_010117 [Letharia columbiana]
MSQASALVSIHRSNNKSENDTQKARPKERQQRSPRSLAYQRTIPPVPLPASLRRRLPRTFRSFPCQSKTPLPPPPIKSKLCPGPKVEVVHVPAKRKYPPHMISVPTLEVDPETAPTKRSSSVFPTFSLTGIHSVGILAPLSRRI